MVNNTNDAAVAGPPPEDDFASSLLAVVGGAATLLGIGLLLVMAVANGWIGEEARVSLAAAASLGLLVAGGRLYERRGRTDAAAAMTAVGVLGLDASLVVAASVYELIPALPALAAALLLAAVVSALCLRWRATAVAVATMLGGLAAPVAVGAAGDPQALPLLLIAYGAVAAVCARQDWGALALGAFLLVTPQWTWTLAVDERFSTASALATVIAFGLVGAVLAVGAGRPRVGGLFLLALNALVTAGTGFAVLDESSAWLVAVALAHLALGLAPRLRPDLRTTALALGVLTADIAAQAILDDAFLLAAWVAGGLAFAALHRRPEVVASGGLALHTSLAVGQVLLLDARAPGLASTLMLALVAASCLVSGQLTSAHARLALQAVGLALFAYATARATHGAALAVAYALEATALAGLARRGDEPAAGLAALVFLGLAGAQALLVTEPNALVDGLGDPLAAAVALGATALAAAFMAPGRPPLQLIATGTALYLASAELVTALPGQRGQLALSALWALTGVAALLAGLRGDRRPWRVAALALLGVTATKVAIYDLDQLEDLYRVASCIALGLLLLAAAFAWQHLRPRALTDLRRMPPALR